jgi:aminocarboxymuconate-semialdehyde decarboxylase
MTVVDVHTHFLPRFVLDEAAGRGLFGVREEDGWLVHPEGFRYPVPETFLDAATKLADMDERGIDVSVLSSAPTLFFYDKPPDEAADFARRSNDALAQLIAGHKRLFGFATLPLQSPDAVAELERAVNRLGFVGAQIGTNCGVTPIDSPDLDPVLAVADRLGVPLMLHPYYVGPKPGLSDFYFTNSIGNPLDTCIAAARLMHSGVFDRYARLSIVLVHGGGFLPYQLGRLDHSFAVRTEPRSKTQTPPSSSLRRFWVDTITHSAASLAFLASLIGIDRLVVGTDLAFDMADPNPVATCEAAAIDPHALGATATKLLKISTDDY